MANNAAVNTGAYPKRKRAETSYKESSSDESEGDDEYGASNKKLKTTASKKLKASRTAVSTKPLPKRKIFPFMLLPAELKNEIYALALIHPNGVYLVSKTKRYRYTVQMQPTRSPNTTIATLSALTPNILLLNRAIHAETQPILYGGNTFALEDTKTLHAFLANIGHKNCATLTDITLLGWGTTRTQTALNYPAFTLLVDAVKLQHLHLDCRIDWGGAKSVAKQLYRNGIHWLEAVGVAKGRFDAAIEVIEISDCNFPDYKYSRAAGDIPSPEERIEEFRAVLRKMLH